MRSRITAEVWYWRGPSPYHFLTVPTAEADTIRELAADVSYGWGMIPVDARIGDTIWSTSLYPRDGGYALPLRDAVRSREGIDVGDIVTVTLTVRPRR